MRTGSVTEIISGMKSLSSQIDGDPRVRRSRLNSGSSSSSSTGSAEDPIGENSDQNRGRRGFAGHENNQDGQEKAAPSKMRTSDSISNILRNAGISLDDRKKRGGVVRSKKSGTTGAAAPLPKVKSKKPPTARNTGVPGIARKGGGVASSKRKPSPGHLHALSSSAFPQNFDVHAL